ncbi:DUF5712 family protein [Mucilaginibacter antarcticus]|uniref:DUF5712 family protein n=1 Tax=Mucilaginibacter antarcticus TaxID=1855725 RepID=UPI00363EBB18
MKKQPIPEKENAGSCSGLVGYLEKENKELAPGQQPEMWFNAGRQDITRRRSLTISITTKRVVGHRIKIF